MQKLTKKEKREIKRQEWQDKAEREKRNILYKKIGIFIGAILIITISIVGLIKLTESSGFSSSSEINVPPISKSDITKGNPKSKVTLIEYADFQCPACAAYHSLINQLLIDFNNKIFYTYRMFPLPNLHKNTFISAQAAYAAYKQNKFFEMSDYLFNKQTEWSELPDPTTTFTDYAKLLKLDENKFKTDMNSDEARNYVTNSQNQALNIGIKATPTFFVNNKQIQNPANYNEFKKIIQNELNKK